ncbi:hypothetical protein [Olivibacter sp. XZL3]|uniref:hypothetical protein n=1 Tax=Olivibacter sp. XZL3 TaxID=1735116 RepID=UPI001065EC40|nr:hypothetical protein [Olivibacter sp. XZL3]
MSAEYFKARKSFDFHPHRYELGNILGLKKGYADNHFLLKIYGLDAVKYEDYYLFHLQYYLSKKTGTEKDFLKHVWHIAENRIAYYRSQDPFSLKHALHISDIEKLTAFLECIAKRDRWNIRPNDVLISEKDKTIAEQQYEIESLRSRLAELEEFEVSVKAMIQDDHLPTFMDLLHQLKNLSLPNGRKLLKADYDSPYYKLVAKYFTYEGKDIPINSARNYFVQKDSKDAKKGVKIPEDKKLFLIVPRKEK